MVNEEKIKNKLIKISNLINQNSGLNSAIIPEVGHDSSYYNEYAFSIDTYFQSTHFPTGMSLDEIGYKSIVASISDIVASGAKPIGVNIGLILPKNFTVKKVEKIYKGIEKACLDYRLFIFKGDTKNGKELGLSVCSIGKLYNRRLVKRYSAHPGDAVYISNCVGNAAIGLEQYLQKNMNKKLLSFDIFKLFSKSFLALCKKMFLNPEIKSELSELISSYATSACDISDGFFYSLRLLNKIHKIEITKLPVHSELLGSLSTSQLIELLSIGEDYCHLFTVRIQDEHDLIDDAKKLGLKLIKIGKIGFVEDFGIFLQTKEVKFKLRGNSIRGYDSFSQ